MELHQRPGFGSGKPLDTARSRRRPKAGRVSPDGQANIPISEAQLKGIAFTFRFYINEKPYSFEGKVEGKKLDGKYSGEEASGRLRCAKAAN